MDDSGHPFIPPRDQPDDGVLDQWLKTWFQLALAEPAPQRLLDLVEQLDAGGGM